MKGPMRGILKVGPAIEPFCLMYMTVGCISCIPDGMGARDITLIVRDDS